MQTDTEQLPAQEQPTEPQTVEASPVPQDMQHEKKRAPTALILLILLFVVSFGAAMFLRMRLEGRNTATEPQPQAEPTVSEDAINPIATTSAFLTLEADIGTFRETVRRFSAKDPLYVPPEVGTGFDFSNP